MTFTIDHKTFLLPPLDLVDMTSSSVPTPTSISPSSSPSFSYGSWSYDPLCNLPSSSSITSSSSSASSSSSSASSSSSSASSSSSSASSSSSSASSSSSSASSSSSSTYFIGGDRKRADRSIGDQTHLPLKKRNRCFKISESTSNTTAATDTTSRTTVSGLTLSFPTRSINPDLVIKYLRIISDDFRHFQTESNPSNLENEAKPFLKKRTTYSLAKNALSALLPGTFTANLKKTIIREIFITASIQLYYTQYCPTIFSYEVENHNPLNFIAYRDSTKLKGKISLYDWSGVTDYTSARFLGEGSFSIAQLIVEMSSKQFFVLKSLRTDTDRSILDNHMKDLLKEIELLKKIEMKYGPIKGLQRSPLLSLPPQRVGAGRTILYGAHIQEYYRGDLSKLNYQNLDGIQKISLFNEFANIIKLVEFFNSSMDIDGHHYVHGDIKRQNILFRYNPDRTIELCLSDFGLIYTYDSLIKIYTNFINNPNRFPGIYTTNYFLLSDKILIKEYLKNNQRKLAEDVISAMEVYALGMVLKNILSNLIPENFKIWTEKDRFHPEFYPGINDLIVSMLKSEPFERPSFTDARAELLRLTALPYSFIG